MKSLKFILYSVYALLLVYLPVGCQSDKAEDVGGPFDANARIESSLGDISLASELTGTRAATYTPLGNGETFRLYAFRRGVTDPRQIVVSYTYTMVGGKPVMDADQGDGKLYLPYGDLDVYLVGPVSVPSEEKDGNGNPVMISVASPSGVIPRQGVDLIASCTPVTINYTGTNKVNPLPLKHKMAKVRVRVNRNSDNYILMKYLKLTKVELYNQYNSVGEFTFGADGGTITPLPADSVGGASVIAEGDQIKALTIDKEYYADFMLLPRKAGYQKIEVEMDITLTNEEKNPYRMSGITRDIEFVGGMQNMLFTEPEVSNDIVWRPELLPWDEEDPVTPPMGGDMILYLDGRDAPEMINGKLCWRDRSGNSNHAEILSTGITYNAERMCYEFPTANDKMQIPALGYIPDYTLEIIAESVPSLGEAINFSDIGSERCLFLHLPYNNNNIYFDSGNINAGGRIFTKFSSDELFSYTFRTYYFKKSYTSSTMWMGVDGVEKLTGSGASKHGEFKNNYIGGKVNLKIRSIRLYRKALSSDELKMNYQTDKTVYKQESDIVTNGLILNLDGKTPPVTKNGETYWLDMSGNAHHAKFVHKVSGKNFIHHNGNGYEFNNVNDNERSYMEVQGSLGINQNFTFEVVFRSDRPRATVIYSTANYAGSTYTLNYDRGLNIHMPWDGSIYFDCPYAVHVNGASGITNPGSRFQYTGPVSTVNYLTDFHYHAFQREDNASSGIAATRYFSDGVLIYSGNMNLSNVEMKTTVIGHGVLGEASSDWLKGEILTMRLYNRVLTTDEILKNSRADRARYKY